MLIRRGRPTASISSRLKLMQMSNQQRSSLLSNHASLTAYTEGRLIQFIIGMFGMDVVSLLEIKSERAK